MPDNAQQVAIFAYLNRDGTVRYEVVRYEWPNPEDPGGKRLKTFRQRRPNPKLPGHYIWKMTGVVPVPYNLPGVLKGIAAKSFIYVVEGEKAADALIALGAVATTSHGGAGKWSAALNKYFEGADVDILADNDEAGHKHGKDVAIQLSGIAKRIRIVTLPDLPPKGDAVDWIAADPAKHTLTELRYVVLATKPFVLTAEEKEEVAAAAAPAAPEADWMGKYDRHKKTKSIYSNLSNALVALNNDPKLQGIVAFDLMGLSLTINKPVPGSAGNRKTPRRLDDDDLTDVQAYLQRACYLPGLNDRVVRSAVASWAAAHPYHPIRDRLNALKWDGKVRLPDFLADYAGTANGAYERKIGTMFLISMVARIFVPGCKVDHMLVFEGPQGVGKSSFCRVLAGGDEYFSDNMPDVRNKDAAQHVGGRWLIEFSELEAMGRAQETETKAFLSRRSDKYRPPYKAIVIDQPRQCVFIGTTNSDAYLHDETGGRRFWPVKVGEIDLKSLARDRDQLLAEAVDRYRKGEPWWLGGDPEEREIVEGKQSDRYDDDPWTDFIRDYLGQDLMRVSTTLGTVAIEALKLSPDRIGTADQRRVAKVLTRLGWERGGLHPKNRQRQWVRKLK